MIAPGALDLAEAVLRLPVDDRDALVFALVEQARCGAPTAPVWEALAAFVAHVRSCEERRLIEELTAGTVVAWSAVRMATAMHAEPVLEAVAALDARTRLGLARGLAATTGSVQRPLWLALCGACVLPTVTPRW